MPAPTVDELLTTLTEDQIKETILAKVATKGFPVYSWATTSVPRALIAGDARAHLAMAVQIPTIVKGGFLRDSTGDWLKSFAESNYLIDARAATFTRRTLRLTDDGAGPLPLAARSVIVEAASGLRYVLDEAVAVPLAGFVDAIFEAEAAGSAYNAATGSWGFVTAVPGVDVSEPAPTIVDSGTDAEGDDSIKQRAQARWPELGTGSNDPVYEKWAREADATVTRVKVRRHFPAPGDVTVVVAGDAGVLSAPVVAAVVAYIAPKAPNCVTAYAVSAAAQTLAVVGTVYALAAELAAGLQARAEARLNALAKALPIGLATLPVELIEEQIMAEMTDDPRNDVDLSAPTIDTVGAGVDYVIGFDLSGLVWTAV